MRRFLLPVLLILSICAQTLPAASRELVVIAASNAGRTLTPGTTLKSGQKVVLPAGSRLTILEKSGKVIRLKGPYSGSVGASGKTTKARSLAAVGRLFGNTSSHSKRLGATRGALPRGRHHRRPRWRRRRLTPRVIAPRSPLQLWLRVPQSAPGTQRGRLRSHPAGGLPRLPEASNRKPQERWPSRRDQRGARGRRWQRQASGVLPGPQRGAPEGGRAPPRTRALASRRRARPRPCREIAARRRSPSLRTRHRRERRTALLPPVRTGRPSTRVRGAPHCSRRGPATTKESPVPSWQDNREPSTPRSERQRRGLYADALRCVRANVSGAIDKLPREGPDNQGKLS